jgi:glycosyltransferase involved in cell wall biosynthesis
VNVFVDSWKRRQHDIMRASKYDIIFVQREAFMTPSIRFEKSFAKSGAKVIFDFDDAIWKLDISDGNKMFKWLKDPAKIPKIISHSHHVIAGNPYLGDYASQFNKNVTVIPTTIDTDYHLRKTEYRDKEKICIGWTGSLTTIKHFRLAENILKKLKLKYGEKISFKVIGEKSYRNEELGIIGIAWNRKTEISELEDIDIGIMPLEDDEWSKGKCGFKGLQYMAMEIPAVLANVGVNTEIIQHGENGFIAKNEEEWFELLSQLIDSFELRKKLGKAGRKTIEEKYSVESQKERYLEVVRGLIKN